MINCNRSEYDPANLYLAGGYILTEGPGLYLETALDGNNKTPYSYPAHSKPTTHIAKPITKTKGFLKSEEYQELLLVKKEKLSSNTYLLFFKLPSEKTVLGLLLRQHISIRAEVDDKPLSRSYTPVSNNSDPGQLRLVIKWYPDGALTETIGKNWKLKMRSNSVVRKAQAICEAPTDKTKLSLLYPNNTESNILLKSRLDEFAKTSRELPGSIRHVNPPEDWMFATGRVTKEMIGEFFPKPGKENKALLCGPPGMIDAMKKSLVELGWDKPNAVSKLPDQVSTF